jgi:hypothetical protein
MADYPSLVKSWQFSINQLITAQSNLATASMVALLAIVNSFLGLNSNPVTLSGTVTTTNGVTGITFSTPQTLPSTAILYFSNQPGVPYYLTGAVTSSTSATLTSNYTGIGGSGQTTTTTSAVTNPWTVVSSSNNGVANSSNNWVPVALSGTVTTTAGSTSITFSTNQTLPSGAILYFSNQPGVPYYLNAAVSASTSGTLTSAYTGTGGSGQTTSATYLTWAAGGTAHSWIVLEQTGIGTNFQILFACSNANSYELNFWFSPSVGFSGGTTTADPTATDSVQLYGTNFAWGVQSSANIQYKIHVMMSTDGACTRMLICQYGGTNTGPICTGYLSVEAPKNPVSGWTPSPAHVMWLGSNGTTQQLTYGNLYNAFNGYARATSNFTLEWTGENQNGTLLVSDLSAPNDLNGEWLMQPIGLYSNTVGSKGRHGELFDIWWGVGNSAYTPFAFGQGYNNASTWGFVQIGAVIFPWNNVVAQLT